MQSTGRARSDAECARLLGVTPRYVSVLKQKGGSRTIALACAAIEAGVEWKPSRTI
jgi:hypothetical protein